MLRDVISSLSTDFTGLSRIRAARCIQETPSSSSSSSSTPPGFLLSLSPHLSRPNSISPPSLDSLGIVKASSSSAHQPAGHRGLNWNPHHLQHRTPARSKEPEAGRPRHKGEQAAPPLQAQFYSRTSESNVFTIKSNRSLKLVDSFSPRRAYRD